MAATTAVVAGTAGAVSHHQQQKYANQEAEQQAQAQAAYEEGAAAAQQQAAAAPAPAPEPAPAPASAGIDMAQLQQLADLHTAGVLTDEEFAASKAKILAGG
jgi:3-oxoacyl-ACP reductase-like protein